MERLIQLAKVFSDINRLKILILVLRDSKVCVCEICDTLELSQPLVSRHLKQMCEAGILESMQEGKWVIYSLAKNLDSTVKKASVKLCC
ncbi:MAG: metalloregulator ArsR/SmtB family transcription factor [Sulfuricurvum sp.]|nr:metalloregulator ArsR/SmtB family transcription factor [Sulfuricurvum sp.]MDD2949197.1 metalloregulator ArsR/SmtB family transcription factor [Sulfuricurvum sp.]